MDKIFLERRWFGKDGLPTKGEDLCELSPSFKKKIKIKILKEMKETYEGYGLGFDWEMCGEAIDNTFKKLEDLK